MTEFVEDLFSFLSDAGTDAGARIYPNVLPQGVTLPACRYMRVSNPKEHSHSGPSALKRPRFQVDCFAGTYLGAVRLAGQMEANLDGFQGAMGAYEVQASFMEEAGRDDYDPETGRHRVSVDVVIWHKETI
jgi:hypothetical protein